MPYSLVGHFNKCSTISEDKIPDTQWLCVSCSTRNDPTNEKETRQYDNNEVLNKLLEDSLIEGNNIPSTK
jgi:hypothetical protein